MSDQSWQGELRSSSFASLVGRIAREEATGVLEIHDVIGTNRAFFLQGAPQGAKLSRLKFPVGRILADEKLVKEDILNEALTIHNRTQQLIGTILLEMKAVDEATIAKAMSKQSMLNFYSLFGLREGRYEFSSGLVHLSDFTASPMVPLSALYEGMRDYAPAESLQPFLASLTFASISVTAESKNLLQWLGPAEQLALRLLDVPRFSAELARGVPLSPQVLAAFLATLHELGCLKIGPAILVERSV